MCPLVPQQFALVHALVAGAVCLPVYLSFFAYICKYIYRYMYIYIYIYLLWLCLCVCLCSCVCLCVPIFACLSVLSVYDFVLQLLLQH